MSHQNNHPNRREFLKTTSLAGAGVWLAGSSLYAQSKSPNEKLNIALIGAGGKGEANRDGVSSQNIVALCDVDDDRAKGSFAQLPKAKRYKDYRKMLDEMHKEIDAVVVSTPDHSHAPASIMAMKLGKHVYCEKPLTHSIYEARRMREVAKEYKVATQMGNQGTADDGLRRAVEVIRSGAIGPVRQVHVWTNRPGGFWAQGMAAPAPAEKVPAHMDWDLWLGPAPERDYNHVYAPFAWRGWWDFGTGAIGDMACHTANMAFMALNLRFPTSAEAFADKPPTGQSPPDVGSNTKIKLTFPARGDQPPVDFYWYEGGNVPSSELSHGEALSDSGSLLVGDKGTLFSPNDYGAQFILLPKKDFEGFKDPEPSLPRSPGHYLEWIAACKGGLRRCRILTTLASSPRRSWLATSPCVLASGSNGMGKRWPQPTAPKQPSSSAATIAKAGRFK